MASDPVIGGLQQANERLQYHLIVVDDDDKALSGYCSPSAQLLSFKFPNMYSKVSWHRGNRAMTFACWLLPTLLLHTIPVVPAKAATTMQEARAQRC
jgi:hypothetical protein